MYRHFIALFIILFVIGILPLAAQTSSLQGLVNDPSGAVIPGAVVTMTNTETSASRQELTDELGSYRFLQMLPGPYRVNCRDFERKFHTSCLQVGQPETLHSWNDDLALSKSFRVSEGKQVSLRLEAYNLTNTSSSAIRRCRSRSWQVHLGRPCGIRIVDLWRHQERGK